MTWVIGKIVGNPAVLVWGIIAAFIIGAASGGSAAWTTQGWRLTASRQELTQYKLDQATQDRNDLIVAKADSKRLSDQLLEAQNAAKKREQDIRILSSNLVDSRQRLRNSANKITSGLPGYSSEALRITAQTFAELFADCQGKYAAVAESADRHASDVETLSEGWPESR